MNQQYIIHGFVAIEEVLPYIPDLKSKIFLDWEKKEWIVNLDSDRLRCFRQNIICVVCGAQGSFFLLEKQKNGGVGKPHLNLYSMVDGKRVMLTKDHIKPRSRGGKDNANNFQTMCITCNSLKGSKTLTIQEIKDLRIKRGVRK